MGSSMMIILVLSKKEWDQAGTLLEKLLNGFGRTIESSGHCSQLSTKLVVEVPGS